MRTPTPWLVLLVACGGGGSGDEAPEALDVDPREPVMAADAGVDARVSGRDARSAPLDASRPRSPNKTCEPGEYEGAFMCTVSGVLPWNGNMKFALVDQADGQGEFTTLSIVPGTTIQGEETTYGGDFHAELEGEFDCLTGELTGVMQDGIYNLPNSPIAMSLRLAGSLQGTYGSDASVPGFQGVMGPLTSPDFEILGPLMPVGECTWSALRVGPGQMP